MKFLTPDVYAAWCRGEDNEWLNARLRYDEHLRCIQDLVPKRVVELARLPGLDDALVLKAISDQTNDTVSLRLRCGDLRIGYFDLDIVYLDGRIAPRDERELARIARGTANQRQYQCDLAFHEIDLLPGGQLVHNLLFHGTELGGRSFSIACKSIRWRRVTRRTRRFRNVEDRFHLKQ